MAEDRAANEHALSGYEVARTHPRGADATTARARSRYPFIGGENEAIICIGNPRYFVFVNVRSFFSNVKAGSSATAFLESSFRQGTSLNAHVCVVKGAIDSGAANILPDSGAAQQITSVPVVNVSTTQSGYDILAKPYFSNSTLASAESGYLTVNGTTSIMEELNSSAFEYSIPFSENNSNTAMVYLFSPGLAGGYASIQLPIMSEVIFIESGLPPGLAWWVDLNSENQSLNSSVIGFWGPKRAVGTYGYSTGASGYSASLSTVTESGANLIYHVTFSVIPEFPSVIMLLLFMVATLAVTIYRRKNFRRVKIKISSSLSLAVRR